MAVFQKGDRVRQSSEYLRTFPPRGSRKYANGPRAGTILGRAMREREIYRVQWDDRRTVERLHEIFIEPLKATVRVDCT